MNHLITPDGRPGPTGEGEIHALVDADGLPVVLKLTEGQAHDGRSAADMLATLGAGHILLADRAYDSDALRKAMAAQGAWANIKPVSRRVNIPAFSRYLYRSRNIVERFFNKLKRFRAIATRYDKYASNYLALVKLAATRIWLRTHESVPKSRFQAILIRAPSNKRTAGFGIARRVT